MIEMNLEMRDELFIVHLHGDGDLDAATELKKHFDQLLADLPHRVVLHMDGVGFASSMFMGTLVQFRGRMKKHGGHVSMCALQPRVAEAFTTARLDWIIPTFATLDQALAAGDATTS